MVVASGTWGTCSVALSLQGPAPPRKTLGVPASGLPNTVPGKDWRGGLSFRRTTQRGGRSALGPRLQKWVTIGKKSG